MSIKKIVILGLIGFILLFSVVNSLLYASKPKIAVINIEGVISGYKGIISDLEKAQFDQSIKAVVVNVNSPGGAVGASQEIYRAIEKLREKKPVVVSMGNVAASGGYYVSAAANVIYANPGTITGSIGVIVQHMDLTELMKKVGVKIENIKSGKNKDILYPNNKLTPEQKKLIEATVKDVYEQFLDAIVKYRPIKKEELRKVADGRIFSGRQAKNLKLVDKLGNLQDAISEARKLAGKEGKTAVVIEFKKPKSLIERIAGTQIPLNTVFTPSGLYYILSY